MKKLTSQEIAVNKILAEISVDFSAIHIALVDHFNSKMDKFCCVFINRKTRKTETFDFYTGLAHRFLNKPNLPTSGSVLYSLMMDMAVIDESFEDWCGNLGYNTYSISDKKVYKACKENAKKLQNVFSAEEIKQLTTALEDS